MYGNCLPPILDDINLKNWYFRKEVYSWLRENFWTARSVVMNKKLCTLTLSRSAFISVKDLEQYVYEKMGKSPLIIEELKVLNTTLWDISLREYIPKWTIMNHATTKVGWRQLKRQNLIRHVRVGGHITLYNRVDAWLFFVEQLGIKELTKARHDPSNIKRIQSMNLLKERNMRYVW